MKNRMVVVALLALPLAGIERIFARPIAADSNPVHHIVLVDFRADVPAGELRHVLREFEQLPARIPGVIGFQWGTDNSPEGLQKGFTHGFFMTFESAEALEAYLPHPEHQAFVKILRPAAEKLFVFDFHIDEVLPPEAPGRVHHLVFFDYKDSAPAEQVARVNEAFAALPLKIPGLLRLQAGANIAGARGLSLGMTHGFALTFVNRDARDDYLPHPAHRDFGAIVGPVLENVLVLDFTVRPSGRGLLVTDGLEPYRVYQRGEDDTAKLRFSGLAADDGPIEARLLSGRRIVPGFDWRRVGEASAGAFEGALAGVPAGGDYTVEIRRRDELGNVAENTEVANLLVGDIWILAGQSNMEGVGDLVDVESPSPLVHAFTMQHRWELAVEPLHWIIDSRDPVHYLRRYGGRFEGKDEEGRRAERSRERETRRKGAGLGLPFAKAMVERTGVPIGLIASAHGGTSIVEWDPALKDRGGESLYGSMLRQVSRAGGRARGVLWYQGESDANPERAPQYADRFKALIAAFRDDLGDAELPFYYVQIGRFVIDARDEGPWKRVQEVQRTIWRQIPGTQVVSVIDLALDDLIHVGTRGLKRAGERLARIALREVFDERDLHIGPRLAGLEVEDGRSTLRVRYEGVNGELLPEDRVLGFSVRGADGAEVPLIYSAAVDPKSPTDILLKLRSPAPAGATLWYGAGLDPVCNLVDAADMAALASGPLPIE